MPLDERDLDLLSAYLDNALTTEERAQVESRLAAEPDLRRELERLRLTSSLIGTLPTLRPPRPLTLTRQMVTPRVLVFPATVAFSAISAAAAIIVLMVGVLLLSTGREDSSLTFVVNLPTNTAQTADLFSQDAQEEAADQTAATEIFNFAIQATLPASTPTLIGTLGEAGGAAAPVEPEAMPLLGTLAPTAAEAMDDGLAEDSAMRRMESPTAEIAAMEIAPFAAQAITDTPSPLPTRAIPTVTLPPSPMPTQMLPSATLQPSSTPFPSPTSTPIPPQPAATVGDGSSIGVALIVIAALLFGLSATAFMRRRG